MSIVDQLEKRKKLLSFLNSPSREEVFTPVKLVEEMLDKLPKEVWSNPDLLWCDPCSKSGVFMLEVVIRLMKHLPIKDETLRYNHIINNMVRVYVNVERNKWLVSKMVYGSTEQVGRVGLIDDINKINTEEMPKFDVIVGNPPYHKKKKESNKGVGSGNAIWQVFVEKSFSILKDRGYLCFIHPIEWRLGPLTKKKHTAQKLILCHQIIYAKLHQMPFTGVNTTVDWYVLKNIPKINKTVVEFNNQIDEIFITEKPIPNYGGDIIKSIEKKVFQTNDNGFINGSSFWFDPDPGTHKKYPYVHGGNYVKNEYKWYDTPHKDQFTPKVIMAAVRQPRPVYDSGKFGIAGHANYIPVTNKMEADFFIKVVNSNLIKFFFQIYASDQLGTDGYGARWQNNYVLTRIKLSETKLSSEKDVYEYFKLSDEERDYIENHLK